VGSIISTLPAENVYELGFSPLGTYVITWQRPSKDEAGDALKNLKVWRVVEDTTNGNETEKETVGKFVQKSQTGWNLQYTFDERFCARIVTNEVQIYESQDLTKVWNKLRVEGVADFAISPGENHSIAVFIPERKVRGDTALTGDFKLTWIRANPRQCEYTTYLTSTHQPRRRTSSKVTRFSLSGTTMAPALSSLLRRKSTRQTRITTARRRSIFLAPMEDLIQGLN
jgi:hypothetical protein